MHEKRLAATKTTKGCTMTKTKSSKAHEVVDDGVGLLYQFVIIDSCCVIFIGTTHNGEGSIGIAADAEMIIGNLWLMNNDCKLVSCDTVCVQ